MTEAVLRNSDLSVVTFTAGAAMSPGEVVAVPDGRLGVVQNSSPVASGDAVSCRVLGDFEMAKEAPLVISAGDAVYWDVTNNNIDKTGSNTYAGIAIADAASADTVVRVQLNHPLNLAAAD